MTDSISEAVLDVICAALETMEGFRGAEIVSEDGCQSVVVDVNGDETEIASPEDAGAFIAELAGWA